MATTSKYLDRKEYVKSGEKPQAKTQTNPRYRNFTQLHFTAGDEEQFQKHITTTNCERKEIDLTDNLWASRKDAQNHENVSCSSVMETFRMLFHTTKKGIFCKIVNNKLEVFLPFSKHNFDNGWAKRIDMSEIEVQELYAKSAKTMHRRFNARWLNKLTHQWAGNSFLIRSEYPVVEGDSNVGTLKNMFETLCDERELPDIEFFLNRRDFPLLRKDGRHPYIFLAGSDASVSCKAEKYLPVLSMCGHNDYLDEKSPTYEDWSRICFQQSGIQFASSYLNRPEREYPLFAKTPWNKKISKAVFRGASTGHGITSETNPRLKLCEFTDPRLDVGITKLNNRPRAFLTTEGLTTFKIIEEEVKIVSPLSPTEQSKYKYIINVGGHSCAFRLSLELGMGSVILLVKNEYTLWFMEKLIPGKHYLEIESDLSNLTQVLDWCEVHQKECKEIALAARKFHDKYLSREGILDYLQTTIAKCKKRSGYYRYNVVSGLDVLASVERKYLRKQKFNPTKATWKIEQQSKSTEIATATLLYNKKDMKVVRKKPITEKLNELRHEAFVASVIKNDEVGRQISSFVGIDPKMTQTYWRKINGITLADYLTSPDFDLEVLKDITSQVCGILQYLQDTYSFCHRDLFAWNIMLEKCQESRVYANKFGFWRSSGPLRVVIIDFGKAHVIHNSKHHGIIKPYEFSTVQDIVTYIVSVSHILLSTHCDKTVLSWLFKFTEFLSAEPEYYSPAKSVRELRSFLSRAKKYTEISYSDKGLLESFLPGDLVTHIGLRVEDKRLRSPTSVKRILKLRDDIFDNPDTILKICKNLRNYVSDANLLTFKYIAKLITTMNIKKNPGCDNSIYNEIISLLS